MISEKTQSRVRDLCTLLRDLAQMHAELARILAGKMDAMGAARMTEVTDATGQERALVQRIQERNGLRRQLVGTIGGELGLPARNARSMTVTQLSRHVSGTLATALREAGQALRSEMDALDRINRKVAVVTRTLVHHLQCVFDAVRPTQESSAGYTKSGAVGATFGSRIVDAVG